MFRAKKIVKKSKSKQNKEKNRQIGGGDIFSVKFFCEIVATV
jgi:hypothetical protein